MVSGQWSVVSGQLSVARPSYYSAAELDRIDVTMDPRLESLLSPAGPKEFATQFKGLRQIYPDIDSFLADLATLALRLYEPFYDDAPRGFYGLTCAAQAESLFADPWRLYAQQLWGLRVDRKRSAFQLPGSAPRKGGKEERWSATQKALVSQDPEQALSFAQTFLCEPDERNFFRARLSMFGLADLALGGHKFNYLAQSWMLADRLAFRQVEALLFGPLHLFAVADRRADPTEWLARLEIPGGPELTSDLDSSLAAEAAKAFIGGTAEESVKALEDLFSRRIRLDRVFDLLLKTAAQVIANARRGAWLPGLRAFHATFFSAECGAWFEPGDQAKAAALCALLINQASLETRALEPNPPLDEVIRRFCPTNPFDVLRSVISHSDPFASATAVYAILGMDDEKKEELFRTLAAQAAKNDGENCRGHDLLVVSQARSAFQRSGGSESELFPAVAGFVLGQVPKTYSLAAEYGV